MTAETLPTALPSPGDVIGGKYRVDALSASGGMAAIFLGQHLVLGQRVAIKVMLEGSARQEATVERFMREAQAAARVETEHVTRVMDAGLLDNGLPFLIMEFLEGCDLGALLVTRGPQRHDLVVDYALEALEGLAHVHAAGIVHRDLKPSNLFLARKPDGTCVVKLLDFGISKSLVEPSDDRVKALTGNVVVGSPVYMSPEQVKSARSVDPRSDVWSLAVSMYELITGALPFDGDGVGEVLAQIIGGTAQPLRAHRPEVPEGLDAVVLRCLCRDRDERFDDVGQLAAALAPFARTPAAARVARIDSTLVNAPLTRAPTSLGSLHAIRTTQVERASEVVVPPGQSRDASGAFALSRTHADLSRATPRARLFVASRLFAGAALAVVAVTAGSYGLLRHAPKDLHVQSAISAPVAVPVPPPAVEPPQAAPATPPSASAAQPVADRPVPRAKLGASRPAPSVGRPSFLKTRK